MKNIHLIVVGIMLSFLTACASIEKVADETKTITAYVTTLKEKGCDAVPKPVLDVLVIQIKSKMPYPDDGVCNPNWVLDILSNKIKLLEENEKSEALK